MKNNIPYILDIEIKDVLINCRYNVKKLEFLKSIFVKYLKIKRYEDNYWFDFDYADNSLLINLPYNNSSKVKLYGYLNTNVSWNAHYKIKSLNIINMYEYDSILCLYIENSHSHISFRPTYNRVITDGMDFHDLKIKYCKILGYNILKL